MYRTIDVSAGEVTTITLDRPASSNSLTPTLCDELRDALGGLETARVVVLTGADGTFSAGGDLAGMDPSGDEGPTASERYDYIDENGHAVVRALRTLDQPVIAAVSGHAVGAGCNLALACDIIVADETAKFGQVFANVGLHPDCGGTHLLPRQVGVKKACELIFTGKIIDAAEAGRIGLVNEVVPESELMDTAGDMAETIAAGPPIAIQLAKESIYENAGTSLDEALDREALAQLHCISTDDFEEGVTAFMNGRAPSFDGT